MHISKTQLLIIPAALISMALPACKAKKIVTRPDPAPVEVQKAVQPVPATAPVAQQEAAAAPVEEKKPNYNFSNIQFEFDSPILKTSAYPALDNIVTEMKKDVSVKFILNGYSSAEGTPEHNLSLSAERANAVKGYFVNSGIDAGNLTVKGNGESNPVADNTTDAGRILNRRVEVKKIQ